MPEFAHSLRRRGQAALEEELDTRVMVFFAGPRQCGKTTVARQLLAGRGGFQVSLRGGVERRLPDVNGTRVELVSAARFLSALP